MITLVRNNTAIWTDWVGSADSIPDALWNACFPNHLEGKWWYQALEKSHLESQFSFYYAIVHIGDKPVAIVPSFLMDLPMELVAPPLLATILRVGGKLFPSLPYQRTFFVGSVCADEGTVGVIPGVKLELVYGEIQRAVEKKAAELHAAMITWKDFPDSVKPLLDGLCEKFGIWNLVSFPGTSITLKSSSIEDYWQSLKGSHRHNLKKKLKKSKKVAELETSVLAQPEAAVLDECFGLFWQTYERGKTKFEVLNREFFSEIAQNKESHFVILREKASGKMVAFMLCFALNNKVINKFIGIDYNLPSEWFLYFRLWEAALQWVLLMGAGEFQSGQTGYRAKIDVGNELLPLTNYCKHRNPLINKIYRIMSRDVTWSSLDDDLKVFASAIWKWIKAATAALLDSKRRNEIGQLLAGSPA